MAFFALVPLGMLVWCASYFGKDGIPLPVCLTPSCRFDVYTLFFDDEVRDAQFILMQNFALWFLLYSAGALFCRMAHGSSTLASHVSASVWVVLYGVTLSRVYFAPWKLNRDVYPPAALIARHAACEHNAARPRT